MGLTLSTISAVLREVVPDEVYSQLQSINMLFQKIKASADIIDSNNNIYLPTRTGRHSGVYTVAEGTAPRAGVAKRQRMSAALKYTFGTLELTDQTLEAAKRADSKAVVPILEDEIMALIETFEKDINRQWMGDGTGQLCLANGTGTGSTTLIVDTPGTEYLVEGMYIVVGTNDAVAISSVDSATQVTLGTAINWSDNVVITKENTADMMGLKGIVDDGTYVATFQGLSRASYPWMNSYVYSTSGALTIANMTTAYLKSMKYASKGSKLVALMNEDLFKSYGNLLVANPRVEVTTREVLSGGWSGLDFMGGRCAVILDYDVPANTIFFVDLSSLIRAEMTKPFQWLDGEGEKGILTRSASNRTIWEATMKYYAQLCGTKLRANSVMRNQS